MLVETTKLDGVLVLTPKVFGDERGFFMETFNQKTLEEAGYQLKFVQDNHSKSSKGVLRGLHFQYPTWQGKMVRAISGEIFDVAVDIRAGSATFGEWLGVYLNDENKKQLYVPEGFAHGFCVVSDTAEVVYKCTDFYTPAEDANLLWNDPDIGIEWPLEDPQLSAKDMVAPRLSELDNLSV